MQLAVVGGSDAGISAALRARELDPRTDITVVVADAYPNFSICGIPYYVGREVPGWQHLAHRTRADLESAGLRLRLDTRAVRIDVPGRRLVVRDAGGHESELGYDALVVGTGAVPVVPPIDGLRGPDALGPDDGVHVLHTMGDTFALERTLEQVTERAARAERQARAVVIGAGYVGLEMAEGLTNRGLAVTQVERLPEVLPTLDPPLARPVRDELGQHGVRVHTGTTVVRVARADDPEHPGGGLVVDGRGAAGESLTWTADVVLVVTGVTPDTRLLVEAGAGTGPGGAVAVDETMATGLPSIWAAGDCVVTHHRLLGTTYLPLGSTAHKQGRVAGAAALGAGARFAGSLGTQVVAVFGVVAARTGLRDAEAVTAGFDPFTVEAGADDHKAYYPGARRLLFRITGDRASGRLLGAQLVGGRGAEIAKRIDVLATALFHGMTVEAVADLDLSYTPPLGSPWDAVQVAAQAWTQAAGRAAVTGG